MKASKVLILTPLDDQSAVSLRSKESTKNMCRKTKFCFWCLLYGDRHAHLHAANRGQTNDFRAREALTTVSEVLFSVAAQTSEPGKVTETVFDGPSLDTSSRKMVSKQSQSLDEKKNA